jgi:putative ABC transport system permease protein
MFFETFTQDVRIGVRMLVKERSFCALAILVLALGIGGVATMFSVVNATMLRGFSYPNAKRLAGVQVINVTDATQRTANINGFGSQIFMLDYEEMIKEQKSFEYLAGYINGSTVNMTIDGNPQRFTGAYVAQDFFRALGVGPIMGRDFTAEDNKPGAEKVALISHRLWRNSFGALPNVIGKTVNINGKSATVIGVMPPGFNFPLNEDVWLALYNEFPPLPRSTQTQNAPTVAVLGALREGVTVEQAQAEFTTFAKRLAATFADTNKGFDTARVQPLIKSFLSVAIEKQLYAMLGGCFAILLIACVNVMNMQFARATLRAKELAIRSSLGATRCRLIRQMLTESLVLAVLGAAAGILIAFYATDYLQAVTHAQDNPIPGYIVFNIDGTVLAFAVTMAILSAVASGFVPAWIASRSSAVESLKESGRGNTSRSINVITRTLVGVEILISCVLLIAALLYAQAVAHQQHVDYGYDTTAIATARMGLMEGSYPTAESRKLFLRRLLQELRANPAYESVALSNRLRMTFSGAAKIEIEGRTYRDDDTDRPFANFEQVTDRFFETLGSRIREGRDFNDDDVDTKLPVAIVNAAFAQKYFGNASAIGRRFRTVVNGGKLFGPWRTIVGVVDTTRMQGPFSNPNVDDTGFYVPYFSPVTGPVVNGPVKQQFSTIVIRPRGGAARVSATLAKLQGEVSKVDPNLPLYFVGSAKYNLDSFLGPQRILAAMVSIFGLVAIVLASVGLYGVTSFSVNQRTQEFGIRMALGANQRRIMSMVLQQGAWQYAIGAVFGVVITLALAFGVGTQIRQSGQLFDVSPFDAPTYLGVVVVLGIVAFVATIVPARRATRVDPMIALRAE